MPYAIITQDKPECASIREEHGAAHRQYLEENKGRLLAAGAMLDDSGDRPCGSVFLIDTDDRAEAEAFLEADPFTRAGLFTSVTITKWRKAFFNFERLIDL